MESSKSHTIACIVSPVINLCFRAFFYSFLMKGNFIPVLVDNFLCTYSRKCRAVSILRTTTTCYSTIHSVVRCSRLLKRNVVCRGHLFKWISNRSINTRQNVIITNFIKRCKKIGCYCRFLVIDLRKYQRTIVLSLDVNQLVSIKVYSNKLRSRFCAL